MNQKAVVVMPTLNRPEFLALALERLSQTPQSNDLDVRIFLDHTGNPRRIEEVTAVRDIYLPTAEIFQAKAHVMAPSGCWNILHALKSGYESGADYVFLVEEDVMVYPNFFEAHYALQNSGEYFATCGRLLSCLSSAYYTNPGSCFKREALGLVIPHIGDRYFADRRGYLDATFDSMDEASDLDDGLIRRVIRSTGAKVKYPERPICAHQGFHYYKKFEQYQNEGTITERVAQLRAMLAQISPIDRYTKDFEPYDPDPVV